MSGMPPSAGLLHNFLRNLWASTCEALGLFFNTEGGVGGEREEERERAKGQENSELGWHSLGRLRQEHSVLEAKVKE